MMQSASDVYRALFAAIAGGDSAKHSCQHPQSFNFEWHTSHSNSQNIESKEERVVLAGTFCKTHSTKNTKGATSKNGHWTMHLSLKIEKTQQTNNSGHFMLQRPTTYIVVKRRNAQFEMHQFIALQLFNLLSLKCVSMFDVLYSTSSINGRCSS